MWRGGGGVGVGREANYGRKLCCAGEKHPQETQAKDRKDRIDCQIFRKFSSQSHFSQI